MKRVLLALLRFYKRNISPLLPNACIYTPTPQPTPLPKTPPAHDSLPIS